MPGPVVVVHDGAGAVPLAAREAHAEGCRISAEAGLLVLLSGGSALDAVVAAAVVLEDDPRFNAGTGGCLTETGTLELDASLMEGERMRGGAVCALPPFENPIRVARAVLEEGRHLLYAARGAADFARAHGFAPADPASMITEAARARLAEVLAGKASGGWAGGTIGAIACDARGSVAAATSTGGMVGKRAGRVGDTPILGAGTYAEDPVGAASATGDGEAAIRVGLTRTAIESLRAGRSAEAAATEAIERLARRTGGTGGIIVVDASGEVGLAHNTETMSHAIARPARTTVAGVVAATGR